MINYMGKYLQLKLKSRLNYVVLPDLFTVQLREDLDCLLQKSYDLTSLLLIKGLIWHRDKETEISTYVFI